MKLKLSFLLALLFFSANYLIAQTAEPLQCGIGQEPNNAVYFSPFNMNNPVYSGSVDPVVLAGYPPISFDIYFWIIRRSDSTGDLTITDESIQQTLKEVNEYYKGMGICFVLKGYNYIDEDSIYENTYFSSINSYAAANNYVIPNCFNVYLPRSLSSGNGVTNYGENRLVVIQANILGIWGTEQGNTLAHEFAHTFGLRHPWGDANNSDFTAEHVTRDPNNPNYNALTVADKVHDTPAMASFQAEPGTIYDIVDENTCNYLGNNTDPMGTPFSLTPTDVGNIMAYTLPSCVVGFTTGQGIRIREYIDGTPNALSVQAMRSESVSLDLYIKDSPEDFGEEPNISTAVFHNSSDIWIRNQPDTVEEHQNPEYDAINPNYVYVRVTNRGCDTSTGTEELKVYWSKAATALSWNYNWAGNNYPNNGPVIGDLIGTVTIPSLESGEQVILELPWNVPNPTTYTGISSQPWHFCLLARIVAAGDPMATPETTGITYNVSQNNNITGKNLTVIDLQPDTAGRPIGGAVAIGNPFTGLKRYNLTFRANSSETGKRIYDEAEVTVELDPVLLNAWQRGGERATNITVQKVK